MVRMPGTWLKQHRVHHNNHYSHGQMGHSIFFVGGPPCHKCHHSQFKCDDFFQNVPESWHISIHLSHAHCSSFHHLLMVKDLQPDLFQGIFLDSIISNQDCNYFFLEVPTKTVHNRDRLSQTLKARFDDVLWVQRQSFPPLGLHEKFVTGDSHHLIFGFSTTLGNLPKLFVISYQEAFLKHPTHHLKWTQNKPATSTPNLWSL